MPVVARPRAVPVPLHLGVALLAIPRSVRFGNGPRLRAWRSPSADASPRTSWRRTERRT